MLGSLLTEVDPTTGLTKPTLKNRGLLTRLLRQIETKSTYSRPMRI
jgi:hypothetical protein